VKLGGFKKEGTRVGKKKPLVVERRKSNLPVDVGSPEMFYVEIEGGPKNFWGP